MSSELAKAAEEATRRNVMAVKEFTEETRLMVRDLQEHVKRLEGIVMTQQGTVANLQAQLAALQARQLNGGPTT